MNFLLLPPAQGRENVFVWNSSIALRAGFLSGEEKKMFDFDIHPLALFSTSQKEIGIWMMAAQEFWEMLERGGDGVRWLRSKTTAAHPQPSQRQRQ
jgi:hypothetical protein